jgi:very-short-patch-repair endonuclease
MGHRNGTYPNHYKIDVANKNLMIGIELDGGSHGSLERKSQDAKKTDILIFQGWSIYRVSNERALQLYSTFTSVDTLLTSLMES